MKNKEEVTKNHDATLCNLFNIHIDTINTEKNLIWQRYGVMLLANTIFLGFLIQNRLSPLVAILMCFIGIALCIFWIAITWYAWDFLNRYLDYVNKFRWEGYENPVSAIMKIYFSKRD